MRTFTYRVSPSRRGSLERVTRASRAGGRALDVPVKRIRWPFTGVIRSTGDSCGRRRRLVQQPREPARMCGIFRPTRRGERDRRRQRVSRSVPGRRRRPADPGDPADEERRLRPRLQCRNASGNRSIRSAPESRHGDRSRLAGSAGGRARGSRRPPVRLPRGSSLRLESCTTRSGASPGFGRPTARRSSSTASCLARSGPMRRFGARRHTSSPGSTSGCPERASWCAARFWSS